MTILCEKAHAKVNLTLDVLGIRPDGYHDIESIMQTVSLCDTVRLEIGTDAPWTLFCDRPNIPQDSRNLAWKAAKTYFDETGIDPQGLSISIQKNIPSEAGMGGGSADAAAVLRGLERHYRALGDEKLFQVSSRIGSDVPFCLMEGTAMARGRGELLEKLPGMPQCFIVICKPAFSCSTATLYKKLDEAEILERPNQDAMIKALSEGDIISVGSNIRNVFDPVVAAEQPELEQVKDLLQVCGALNPQMTGSGSAVFGVFTRKEEAELAMERLRERWADVFLATPV